jgi:hypothetical protein
VNNSRAFLPESIALLHYHTLLLTAPLHLHHHLSERIPVLDHADVSVVVDVAVVLVAANVVFVVVLPLLLCQ